MARVSMHVTPFWRQCKYLYVSNFRKMTPRVWINEFSIFIYPPFTNCTNTHTDNEKNLNKYNCYSKLYRKFKKEKKLHFLFDIFALKKNIFPTFFSWRQKFCNSFKVTLKSTNALNFLNQLNCSIKVIPIKW